MRTAILVDGMESRSCLSTILSYTCCYEDAQSLARRLCKKGAEFIEKDESSLLKTLCVPKDKLEKQTPPKSSNQQKVVHNTQRAVQVKKIAIRRVSI